MNTDHHTLLPFLIVGQGIAGSLLAHFFLQKKIPFKVIDLPMAGSTSSIAAGVINPITGRRMVKSWRYDELSSFAKKTYLELGELLNIDLFQDMNILRALPTIFDQNEWDRRSEFPENLKFFCKTAELGCYENKVPAINYGELTGSAKVNLPKLIQLFRIFLNKNDLLLEEKIEYEKLEININSIKYKGEAYSKIIFCEGYRAFHNPFFKYLPFSLSKGELLIVKIKGFKVNKMLKHKIYIVPVDDDIYWIGATNSFDYQEITPSINQKEFLKNTLSEMIDLPFKILAHKAGIRPTVSDKRPLLGLHYAFKNLAIFNGLGTKGSSLGPYFANQMVGFLLEQNELDSSVDIKRFDT